MSERSFSLEGPNSGGGRTIVYAEDRVFVIAYGDAAIGYGEVEECSVAAFCARYASHPGARTAVEWLSAHATAAPPGRSDAARWPPADPAHDPDRGGPPGEHE